MTGETVFVQCAQTVAGSRENALDYDDCTSGPTIFTYVEDNPVSNIDPFGLIKGNGIPLGCANAANAAAYAAAGMSPCPPDPAQEKAERDAYHKICDEPPPPNLSPCDLILWKIGRANRCISSRQDYVTKWNDTYAGHKNQIEQRRKEVANLEKEFKEKCCGK